MGWIKDLGRGAVAVATGGASEAVNELSGGGVYGGGSTLISDSGNSADGAAQEAAAHRAENARLLQEGSDRGRERASTMYGVGDQSELGDATQDILGRRRDRMNQDSPASTRLRESRNRRVRMARAGGRSSGEQESIKRQSERDIADSEYNREGQALTDYQKMIGKIISGTSQMELSHMAVGQSGQYNAPPQQIGGFLGSVICTELFKQGYMDLATYKLDTEYGIHLGNTRPHVLRGYHFLARPIVSLMESSLYFTKLISIPALLWADNMSGKYNFIGNAISVIGETICGIVGTLLGESNEERI